MTEKTYQISALCICHSKYHTEYRSALQYFFTKQIKTSRRQQLLGQHRQVSRRICITNECKKHIAWAQTIISIQQGNRLPHRYTETVIQTMPLQQFSPEHADKLHILYIIIAIQIYPFSDWKMSSQKETGQRDQKRHPQGRYQIVLLFLRHFLFTHIT